MLTLIINEQPVDLGDDFSFTMNLKSPLFNETGNYSYPFRLPATSRNAILLGFPHRAENTLDPFVERPARFEWNGITLFSGTALLKSAASGYYEGTIFEGSGDFYYQLKNRHLQQIDMGEKAFSTEAQAISYLTGTLTQYYPQVPVACPQIENKSYFDPPVTGTELMYYNYVYPGSVLRLTTLNTNQRTVIVPMLYLRYVLDKLFAGLGYALDDRVFSSHPDLNRLALYNSTSCNNAGNTTPPRVPADYAITRLIFNYHIPRIKINDFLNGLQDYFALAMFVNNTTRVVRLLSLDEIVSSQAFTEFSDNLILSSVDYQEQPSGYHLSISPDPDDQTLGPYIEIEDKLMALYAGSVAKLSDLPVWPVGEIGSIYWVEDQNSYYQMNSAKNWIINQVLSVLMTRFLFRSGEQKLETKFSPVWFDTSIQTATVTNAMSKYREITPRLMFVEQFSLMGNNGMMARHDTANYSLFYPWEKGLFNRFWKRWMNFRAGTRLVKFTKQMSFSEIRDFDFSFKYMIRGRKYLMKSLQVTLKRDRIAPVSLEGYLLED